MLLTQTFILIGMGHGIAPLLLVEFGGIINLFSGEGFKDKVGQSIMLFGVISVIGQALVIFSMFYKASLHRTWFHIVGIFLLLVGTFFILGVAFYDPYSVVIYWSCIPFTVCIILTFCGGLLERIYCKLV